jgi:hypothetical protein
VIADGALPVPIRFPFARNRGMIGDEANDAMTARCRAAQLVSGFAWDCPTPAPTLFLLRRSPVLKGTPLIQGVRQTERSALAASVHGD